MTMSVRCLHGYKGISKLQHARTIPTLTKGTRGIILHVDDSREKGFRAIQRVPLYQPRNGLHRCGTLHAENAFSFKSTREIVRALFVYRLCSYDIFVRNSQKLMRYGQRVVGRRLFERCMRMTFYGQFVAGDTEQELTSTVNALLALGVRPIVMAPMEEDVTEAINNVWYDENLSTIERHIELSSRFYPDLPVSQLKLTAIVPGKLVGIISEHVPDPHGRIDLIDSIRSYMVPEPSSVTSVKPHPDPAFAGLWSEMFEEDELKHFLLALDRLKRIGKITQRYRVRLLVDAEYTYMNPALRLISLAMMMAYNNGDHPLVAYTYQNYLKKTHRELREDVTLIQSRSSGFGAKLVRGAYMNSERTRAQRLGYDDPVHACFEDTTAMYEKSVEFLMDKVAQDPNKCYFMVASHNEDTVKYAREQMARQGLTVNNDAVLFGQVFGMSDHVSAKLGGEGYRVYKSIPYGRMDVTLPYLQRRAVENTSVLARTATERQLLWDTLKHRLRARK